MLLAGLAFLVGRNSDGLPVPVLAYLSEVRSRARAVKLAELETADLVAKGSAFCAALDQTGNALQAAFQLQMASDVYAGQSYVIAAARNHLCPELPDGSPRDDR